MVHTEASLSQLNKEDLVKLLLDFQQKHDNLFGKLMEDFADLKADYVKLEADSSITGTVSDTFKNRIITLERKCWRNEQYSRCECLEISGIPNGTPDSQTKLTLLLNRKIKNLVIGSKPNTVRGELLLLNYLNERMQNKKKVKSTNLSSLNVQGPVYINNSLCSYYKSLWSKCKSLPNSNFIHSFWVTNSSIRIKVTESSQSQEVSHICDLEELFPGNHSLADMSNWE